MNNKKRLAIIGCGELGKSIAHYAINDSNYNVVGYFDDFSPLNSVVNGIKIIGKISDIKKKYDNHLFDEIIIAIGYNHLGFKEELFNSLVNQIKFATIIHTSCFVDESCRIGKGVCLLPGSVLDKNVTIEDNVIVNIGCTIAHDSTIAAHTFISPRVAVAGFVKIGKRCNIGINTTIIDRITINNDVQTGGATVVISDLTQKGLYVGNPSRLIR